MKKRFFLILLLESWNCSLYNEKPYYTFKYNENIKMALCKMYRNMIALVKKIVFFFGNIFKLATCREYINTARG